MSYPASLFLVRIEIVAHHVADETRGLSSFIFSLRSTFAIDQVITICGASGHRLIWCSSRRGR